MIMSTGGIYMVSDKIKQIMKMKKVTSVQLAQHLGMLPQSLANIIEKVYNQPINKRE